MEAIVVGNAVGHVTEQYRGYTFKDPRLAEATQRISTIYEAAVVHANTHVREIAEVLHKVKVEKSYEKDGFKSVPEYATEVFGIARSNAYALAAAGDVYADDKASDAVKALSPYNAAVVAGMDLGKVSKDIEDGKLSPTATQSQIKEYVKASKPQKAHKGRVVDVYTARIVAIGGKKPGIKELSAPRDMAAWDAFFINLVSGQRLATVNNLPRVAAFKDPLSDDKTVARRVYSSESNAAVVEFYKVVRSKETETSKAVEFSAASFVGRMTPEQLAAMAVFMGTKEGKAAVVAATKFAKSKGRKSSKVKEAVEEVAKEDTSSGNADDSATQ